MKGIILIFGLLGIFCMSSAFAAGCARVSSCGQSYSQSYEYQQVCSPSGASACQCTDPGCYQGNSCLSRSKCCAAFGNMGYSLD